MAYDKIITIHARLDRRINYALNDSKSRGENGELLRDSINCQIETACLDMLETKRRWDKLNGVQGYHIVHSYAPGEVTPEQAQALSMEFANRLLGNRFEAVISTHTDHEHIHSHIIFNAVSCVDGKMFRSDFKAYYGDIRGISNEISREHGLSVIEPKGKGKQYAEWQAEKKGKPTVRGLVRQDIDLALAGAVSLQTMFAAMEKQGYTVKRGANVKHTAIKPPGGERFIRLESLGTGYTEAELKARIGKDYTPKPVLPKKQYRGKRHYRERKKAKGITRLYLYYLYLLAPPKSYRKKAPFAVRAELRRLNQYKQQFELLRKYEIDNTSQLSMLAGALQADIDSLVFRRRDLYKRKRRGEDMTSEISEINLALRPIRRELRCCYKITENLPQVQRHIEQHNKAMERKEISKEKEATRYGNQR